MKAIRLFAMLATMLAFSCGEDPAPPAFDGTIETFAGTTFGHEGEGVPAAGAKLGYITSVAVDANGNVYVSDAAANTIRRINTSNTINKVAGTFIGFNVIDPTPYAGDGGMAVASHLKVPYVVATDAAGNIYIADTGNNVIRKVNANGEINTVVGTGKQGNTGDNGPAEDATIYSPNGIAFDATGNLYFADTQNQSIRKVDVNGKITTVASNLVEPFGVAIDNSNTIYFSESSNMIRSISQSGEIKTVAGAEANLLSPKALAFDKEGNLLVADAGNNQIKRITISTGAISIIAGTGVAGYKGDLGPAVDASLSNPQGIAVAANGNIYVAESGNSVIRLIKPAN